VLSKVISSQNQDVGLASHPDHFLVVDFPDEDHVHFCLSDDFIIGLGKPKLYTKFKVASFSHCKNDKGEPPVLGSYPRRWPCPLFLLGVIVRWALANTTCIPNLKSLASIIAQILETPNSKELSQTRPSPHFLLGLTRLGKPKLRTKFEVASFSHCVYIEGDTPNFGKVASFSRCRNIKGEPKHFMELP